MVTLAGASGASPPPLRCGGRSRLPYPRRTPPGQSCYHLLETTDLSLQRAHPLPQVRGVRVFLTVVRSHILVGSFGFLGFIHPHVVITNTAAAAPQQQPITRRSRVIIWFSYDSPAFPGTSSDVYLLRQTLERVRGPGGPPQNGHGCSMTMQRGLLYNPRLRRYWGIPPLHRKRYSLFS
jgi:hypothetical protein